MQWKGGFDGSNRIPAPSDNLSAFSKLSFVMAACSVCSSKIITFCFWCLKGFLCSLTVFEYFELNMGSVHLPAL